jgi:hypothetical protein
MESISQDKSILKIFYWFYNANIRNSMNYVKIRIAAYSAEHAKGKMLETIIQVLRKGIPYVLIDYNPSHAIITHDVEIIRRCKLYFKVDYEFMNFISTKIPVIEIIADPAVVSYIASDFTKIDYISESTIPSIIPANTLAIDTSQIAKPHLLPSPQVSIPAATPVAVPMPIKVLDDATLPPGLHEHVKMAEKKKEIVPIIPIIKRKSSVLNPNANVFLPESSKPYKMSQGQTSIQTRSIKKTVHF